jgi:hypothetical protein
MNKIVGKGLDSTEVTVTIKAETPKVEEMNLEELSTLQRDVFSSAEKPALQIRVLRDQWSE